MSHRHRPASIAFAASLIFAAPDMDAATFTVDRDVTQVELGAAVPAVITLASAARSNVVVPLTSSAPTVIAVPASVTIPAGAIAAKFTMQVMQQPVSADVTVQAAVRTPTESATLQRALKVLPPPALASIAAAPNVVPGGSATTLTVKLSRSAAYPGVTVALVNSSTGQVAQPKSVVVPFGKADVTTTATTATVTTPLNVEVAATVAGANRVAATLSLQPAATEPPALVGITAEHNKVRTTVGVPALRWSASLANVAQQWAAACVDTAAPIGVIDHNQNRSVGQPYYVGENIYASGSTPTPVAAVTTWAAEANQYNYAANTCTGVCGHYTQVVWSPTVEVGCGISTCPNLTFSMSIVCNYGPGGNTGGRPY